MHELTVSEYKLAAHAHARIKYGSTALQNILCELLVEHRIELEAAMVHYLRKTSNDLLEGNFAPIDPEATPEPIGPLLVSELASVTLSMIAAGIERGEHRR